MPQSTSLYGPSSNNTPPPHSRLCKTNEARIPSQYGVSARLHLEFEQLRKSGGAASHGVLLDHLHILRMRDGVSNRRAVCRIS